MPRRSAKLSCAGCRAATSWPADGLAAHNVIALNAFHRVAGIHHQGCVLRDPGVIVIRMICDDQHTVVFGDVATGTHFICRS